MSACLCTPHCSTVQCGSASCFDCGVQVVEVKIKSAPGEPLGFHLAGADAVSGRRCEGEGSDRASPFSGWYCLLSQTCVCVSNVVPRLPASRAGLKAGDRILKVRWVGRGLQYMPLVCVVQVRVYACISLCDQSLLSCWLLCR